MSKIEKTLCMNRPFYGQHDNDYSYKGILAWDDKANFLGEILPRSDQYTGLYRSERNLVFGKYNAVDKNSSVSGLVIICDGSESINMGAYSNGRLKNGIHIDLSNQTVQFARYDKNGNIKNKFVKFDMTDNSFRFGKISDSTESISAPHDIGFNMFCEYDSIPIVPMKDIPFTINKSTLSFFFGEGGGPSDHKYHGIYQKTANVDICGYAAMFATGFSGDAKIGCCTEWNALINHGVLPAFYDCLDMKKDYFYYESYKGPARGCHYFFKCEQCNFIELGVADAQSNCVGFSFGYDSEEHVFQFYNYSDGKGFFVDRNYNVELCKIDDEGWLVSENTVKFDAGETDGEPTVKKPAGKEGGHSDAGSSKGTESRKSDSPADELDSLIGLSSVKTAIKRLAGYAKYSGSSELNLHMVFTGNPGTGKTEVGKIFGKLLKKYGILPNGNLVEINGASLRAEYTGQTAPKVEKKVREAIGGVLFIDEAGGMLTGNNDDFGHDAVNTLLTQLENNRGKFCCIIAGYEESIRQLFSYDQGLKSRFQNIINFPDYSEDELKSIAKMILGKNGYSMDKDSLDFLAETIYSRRFEAGYANARDIRNAVTGIAMIHFANVSSGKPDMTLTRKEIITYFEENNIKYKTVDKKNDDARTKLKSLIGLERIKSEILRLTAGAKKNKARGNALNLNFVFTGYPGTGKTEVARLLPDLFFQYGVLPSPKLVEVTRKDIINGNGNPAGNIHSIVEKAIGGVLFIDEAYSLVKSDDDTEVVDQLLVELNDNKGKLACVLAGYPREMMDFMGTNPGLTRRFSYTINFPDYSRDELLKISSFMMKKRGDVCSDEVNNQIVSMVYSNVSFAEYGNAGDIAKALEVIETYQANRTINSPDDYEIRKEDVDRYYEDNKKRYPRYGQAVRQLPNTELLEVLRKELSGRKQPAKTDDGKRYEDSAVAIATEEGEGSGFLISDDGFIITCNHVVRLDDGSVSNNICVRLRLKLTGEVFDYQDVKFDAIPVAADEVNDFAVLKIDAGEKKLPYVQLAPKGYKCSKTDTVTMYGYPFGQSTFDNLSVTKGTLTSYQCTDGFRQINYDLDAKHGNSGSMIIDDKSGCCIGILCRGYQCGSEEINQSNTSDAIWDLINGKGK